MLLEHIRERALRQSAVVSAVPVVHLLLHLPARNANLLRVGDDHVVARKQVRHVQRIVLAVQNRGYLSRQPSERLPLGVNDVPLRIQVRRLSLVRL